MDLNFRRASIGTRCRTLERWSWPARRYQRAHVPNWWVWESKCTS